MQRLWNRFFRIFLCILLLYIFSNTTFAAPGDGDGGGGGPAVPLMMDWSCPADGDNNVSITPIIQCKYSHNVALNTVVKRNTTLFSLTKLDGTKVDINVYAADAQLEFDKRQYIYLEPVRPLEYNTTYVVTAKEGIQAKNGMVTENDQFFQFTTGSLRTDFNQTNVLSMLKEASQPASASTAQVKKSDNGSTRTTKTETRTNDKKSKPASDSAKAQTEKPQDTRIEKKMAEASTNHQNNSGDTVIFIATALFILPALGSALKIKRQKD